MRVRTPRRTEIVQTADRGTARRGATAAAVAALLLASAPSAAQTLAIEAPRAGHTLTCMPLDVRIDLDAGADPGTLAVTLNGVDVTAAFDLDPPAGGRRLAWADDLWGDFVACDAGNTLAASVELGGAPAVEQVVFATAGDPYADAIPSGGFQPGGNSGFNADSPEVMLGAPLGGGPFLGSIDVVSLGTSGSVVLEFTDNVIVDGPGADFTVFENSFLETSNDVTQPPFSEPGQVSVSQDGSWWFDYGCDFDEPADGPYWPGCAGVYPTLSDGSEFTPHASIPTDVPIESLVGVSTSPFPLPPGAGGDSFDLAGSGLPWVRYVRITAASFDTGLPGGPGNNAGFDLDAVAAVHSAPEPPVPVPALGPVGIALLALALAGAGLRRSA